VGSRSASRGTASTSAFTKRRAELGQAVEHREQVELGAQRVGPGRDADRPQRDLGPRRGGGRCRTHQPLDLGDRTLARLAAGRSAGLARRQRAAEHVDGSQEPGRHLGGGPGAAPQPVEHALDRVCQRPDLSDPDHAGAAFDRVDGAEQVVDQIATGVAIEVHQAALEALEALEALLEESGHERGLQRVGVHGASGSPSTWPRPSVFAATCNARDAPRHASGRW
jgi:hypothetical protein